MAPRIKQVVVTYVTHRWVMAGIAAWLMLILAPQLVLGARGTKSPSDLAPLVNTLLNMPIFFISILLVIQAKAHFAHWRSRLVPGFMGPHITVLAGLLVILVILFPLLIARRFGCDALGLTALAVAIAAPTIWAAHSNQFLGMLVAMAAFFSTLTTAGINFWFIEAPSHRTIHTIILATGVVLLIGWLWRLSQLREEMGDFLTTNQWRMARKSGTEVAEQRRVVAEQLRRNKFASWFSDVWMARLGGYHGGSLVRLAKLLRFGFGLPAELQGLHMAVWFAASTLFFAMYSHSGKGSNLGPAQLYVQCAMIFPGMLAGEWLAQRRPRIAGELMFPLFRSRLIEGLFAATAWSAIMYWLVMNAGLVLMTWLVANDQFTFARISMMLLMTATFGFALASLSLRTAVWPSLILRLTAITFAAIILQIPLLIWGLKSKEMGDAPFMVSALVAVGVGVFLIHLARRAWLNLELG